MLLYTFNKFRCLFVVTVANSSPKVEQPVKKKKKVELTLREEIEKERNNVAGDPPEVSNNTIVYMSP